MRWVKVFIPFFLSLLVPVWLFLSDLLGYDIFPAPDSVAPRYGSVLLAAVFYIVWWLLFLLFLLPGMIITHPFTAFREGILGFSMPGLVAGLVYTLVCLIYQVAFYLADRRAKARAEQNAPADSPNGL